MAPADPSADSAPAAAPARRGAAAFVVAAGILASRLFGLVRERVFAHYLGNSDAAGAFKAALRIPNLLQNLFGEGVLSASFIPVYARLLREGRQREAARVASVVASLLTVLVAVLVLAGVLLSRPLIDVVAPGFTGDVRELTISMVQIMFPGVGLLVLSAWCLGVLNSHHRFFLPYFAPVVWNVAIIAALFALGGHAAGTRLGQMRLAEQLAWSTVVGAVLQLVVQLPSVVRLVRPLRPSLALGPDERTVLTNFVPRLLGAGASQIAAYISQLLSSYLTASIVAAMAYAQTLYTLPVSLFGMASAAAELPKMSSELGTDEEIAAALRARLQPALARIVFFVVPSTAAFLVLGDVIAATLFQTGKFVAHDSDLVWMILAGSTVGLLAATQARLLSAAFWALRDTRTPLAFALVRVTLTAVAGWAVALPLRARFGWDVGWAAAGLTASAGAAGWLEYWLLRRALVARIGAFSVGARTTVRCWVAAIFGALPAFALHRLVPLVGHPVVEGALVLGLFGAIYVGVTMLLGVGEAGALVERVRRRLRR